MPLEFTVCEVRWDRYPRFLRVGTERSGWSFKSSRGLAANTLDAYGRNLDGYLGFLGRLRLGVSFSTSGARLAV